MRVLFLRVASVSDSHSHCRRATHECTGRHLYFAHVARDHKHVLDAFLAKRSGGAIKLLFRASEDCHTRTVQAKLTRNGQADARPTASHQHDLARQRVLGLPAGGCEHATGQQCTAGARRLVRVRNVWRGERKDARLTNGLGTTIGATLPCLLPDDHSIPPDIQRRPQPLLHAT